MVNFSGRTFLVESADVLFWVGDKENKEAASDKCGINSSVASSVAI